MSFAQYSDRYTDVAHALACRVETRLDPCFASRWARLFRCGMDRSRSRGEARRGLKPAPHRSIMAHINFHEMRLLHVCRVGVSAFAQGVEPAKFFREYVGLGDDQIQAIRNGKALAKVVDSRTPDEVLVFGSVHIDAAPESYLKLASDIDALHKLPSYLAIR